MPEPQSLRDMSAVNRRAFLKAAGASAALLALDGTKVIQSAAASTRTTRNEVLANLWSLARTWGGQVPGPGDVAVITKRIILDVDAQVAGVEIRPGGALVFQSDKRIKLTSTGNVVVEGALVMRPETPRDHHVLQFANVNENGYVGGGEEVKATDVGLWVIGDGAIRLQGHQRLPWTRVQDAVPVGATTITLRADPEGWRKGDELAITPTLPPTAPESSTAYDHAEIVAIDGRTITLSEATKFAHPAVEVEPGRTFTAEVLNLSRNVRVGGTPGGRAHVWIRSAGRQSVQHAMFRHVGPRANKNGGGTVGVVGRYGLHFHHSHAGSALVRGVVVRDAGNHAFVAHLSNRVKFRKCISHNTFEDAFWWDFRPQGQGSDPPQSNFVLYDRCVASLVQTEHEFSLAGFSLNAGKENEARGCVAVGVQGTGDSSGYKWPEGSQGGVWNFHDCVAHNGANHGIWTWQNGAAIHVIDRFVGYYNQKAGISHGAYRNAYQYRNSVLYGNKDCGVEVHAAAKDENPMIFTNLLCDGAGIAGYGIRADKHRLSFERPAQILDCTFRGNRNADIGWVYDGKEPTQPEMFDVVRCKYQGKEFLLGDGIHEKTRIRVMDDTHGTIALRRADQQGVLRPDWNAAVTPIQPFTPGDG
ncbi:MAG: hypothetical protein M3273_06200 [Actinomycetota bacterium]|nr:hypothetical protein [Actinomycetota bacterium]